jgi:PAS domain S-box-containing protein
MNQFAQKSGEQGTNKIKVPNWLVVVIFIAMAVILIGGLYIFYQRQSHQIYLRNTNELKSIAELKVNQILQWHEEGITDIQIYSSNRILMDSATACQLSQLNETNKDIIRAQFELISKLEDYQNILITDCNGKVVFSIEDFPHALENETIELIYQSFEDQKPVFSDILLSPYDNSIYLDVITPIYNSQHNILGSLILRIDPKTDLFPIIQSWPTPSTTAETLIVRREGDYVLFLNILRHDKSAPLSIKIPITEENVPAVQAILGTTGDYAGVDYRGENVVAEIRQIPDTNWFMISKEDEAEILAERRSLAQYVLFMVAFSILLTILLAAYYFSRRQQNLFLNLLNAETIKNKAEEETKTTLYSIGDGVITTDAEGYVTRMNPIAEVLTGWKEDAVIGKPLGDFFNIVNEYTRVRVENPVVHVLKKGIIVGLANHTVLISKDGTERPIADSGAPIRNSAGEIVGVVMVFRDQTQERELQKEKALLYDTLNASINEIYIFNEKSFQFRYVNKRALRNLGYTFEQMISRTPFDIKPEFEREDFIQLIQPLNDQSKEIIIFTTNHMRADRTLYPVEVHLQRIQHEDENVYLAVIQDITNKVEQEEKIRVTEEQYSQLFNEMEEGFALHRIVVNEEGQPVDYEFLDVNPAFEQQTGLRKEDIQFKRVREIIPDIEAYWINTYGEIALTGKSIKYENFAAPLNKWFSVSAFSPEDGQFATISIDITEQKNSSNVIIESEERFRSLFDNMAQGVVYHNANGEIILANEAAKSILGLSRTEMMGKTSTDPQWKSIHEDGSEYPPEYHPAVLAQKTGKVISNSIMGVYNTIKQNYVWININAVPQFRPGEQSPYQTFVTFEDITARKNAEDILKQQLDELRRWNEVVLGREGRVLELKNEINELLEKLGKPPRYSTYTMDESTHE